MHHRIPDPQVHPYPINREQQQASAELPTHDDSHKPFDGSAAMSDDYDLDVGLAGALQ